MKKLLLMPVALAAGLLVAQNAAAVGGMMDVSVVERHSGRVLPTYYHRGEYWVAGTPGAAYSVRVRNNTGERLLAVMSVDGVNVLSGETAAVGQSGYVFDPWRVSDISGWRKSSQEIAAFEFTASPHSYAERTGRPFDVGVIGVALFRERSDAPPPAVWPQPAPQGRVYPYDDPQAQMEKMERGDSAAGASRESSRQAAPASPTSPTPQANTPNMNKDIYTGPRPEARSRVEPKLGTGHGQREYSPTTHTSFERAQNSPNEVIRIRYDNYPNLVSLGVIPKPRYPRHEHRPNPFPDSYQQYGYVPDPPRNWR